MAKTSRELQHASAFEKSLENLKQENPELHTLYRQLNNLVSHEIKHLEQMPSADKSNLRKQVTAILNQVVPEEKEGE